MEQTYYEKIQEQYQNCEDVEAQKEFYKTIDFDNKIEKDTDAIIIKTLKAYNDLAKARVIKDTKEKEKTEIDNYIEGINWVDNPYCSTWKKTKIKNYAQLRKAEKLFFLAHSNNKIEGKPQLISNVKLRIPLIIKAQKNIAKDDSVEIKYKFIDDKYDKRTDGFEADSLDCSFWSYKVISKGEEYILLSKEQLGIDYSYFIGMEIKINSLPEISKNMKLRGISKLFFVKEVESSIVTYDKEELINVTKGLNKDIGLNQDKFLDFLFAHPDGKIYRHSEHHELIRVSQLLSGKYEGYPLHILNIGPPGKGKTMELEAMDFKFHEEVSILEAANSTTKALVPSFKEKPANPGYVLKCRRLSLVDELMKMIHKVMEYGRSDQRTQNHLQELNAILEHKQRSMGSGNDNFFITNPTSKCIFSANPLPGKRNIYEHIGIIDESMLSRLLILIQDEDEKHFINSNKPKKGSYSVLTTGNVYISMTNIKINNILYSVCVPSELHSLIKKTKHNLFINIYDSCQQFLCEMDEDRIITIVKGFLGLIKQPLRSIYEKRLIHHSTLLLDGLTKFRCLFRDFDNTFTSNEEDYQLLEKLLVKIIKSWDCSLIL